MNTDLRQLAILSDLRKQAHVSASRMAEACGLSGPSGRESVRAWELGEAIPQRSRRVYFLDYLLDTLQLRADPEQLLKIWDILVMQWDWDPLSEQELVALQRPATRAVLQSREAGQSLAAMALEGVLPPGSYMPYQRNPYFIGRADELRSLAAALGLMGAESGEYSCVGALGMGGVGKTQLAIEFVYRYGSCFPGGVFWLSAEYSESIPAEIISCGTNMALHADFERVPAAMQLRLVQESWEQPVARLLVFDNCEDPAALQRWRPTRGHTRILVTSRRISWDARLGMYAMPLSLFKRDESLQLLHRHCPDIVLQNSYFVAIAAELDDLPLALHLAGRSLARRRDLISPALYLAQIRDVPTGKFVLSQAIGTPINEHLQVLERSFALSVARLRADDPADALALRLMHTMTCLAHGEPVPRVLYQALLPEAALQQAIQQLLDLGLIEQIDAQGSIRMHRLVATYVCTLATESLASEIQANVEQAMLDFVSPFNQADQPYRIRPFELHLRAMARATQGRSDSHAAQLCYQFGLYCTAVDSLDDAKHYLGQAITIYENLLGKEDLLLADMLHDLAWCLDSAGQSTHATPYHLRALAIRRRVLGDAHPKTAQSWNRVGTAQHACGDFAKAEYAYAQACSIHEQACGSDNLQMAAYMNNLGLLGLFRGQYQGVYDSFKRAIALSEQAPTVNLSQCAVLITNMGYLLRTLAQYDEALPYLQRSLAIRTDIYGEMNSYTAISMNHLGRLYQALGDLKLARRFLEPALEIKRETVPKSGWMSNALSNMGMLCFDEGNNGQALRFLEEALALNLQLWGTEHWHTARTLNHIGILAAANQDDRSAVQYFEQALTIRSRILGEEHPDIANTMGHLAMLDLRHGAVARAYVRISDAVHAHTMQLGDMHPYTARSAMRLGQILATRGDMQLARQWLGHALRAYRSVLGECHAYTQACEGMYNNIQ